MGFDTSLRQFMSGAAAISVGISVIACTGILAGCGGGGSNDASPSPTPTPTPTPTSFPTIPVTSPSPAPSGAVTLSVSGASSDANENASPVSGTINSGSITLSTSVPTTINVSVANGSGTGSGVYSMKMTLAAVSTATGLQAGHTYTVGSNTTASLGLDYTEYQSTTDTREWTAVADQGTITINSISGNTVTFHGSVAMSPSTATGNTATGTFTLGLTGTATLPNQ